MIASCDWCFKVRVLSLIVTDHEEAMVCPECLRRGARPGWWL